ncbi:hypothetical protein Cs7R123_60650 [Catellatospora sp. TT07R-123]|uniref:hypothetical protein n=1 Tax=Catellatospora sp. TT07R-123 TaxID=2733863 RepID=UPI001B2386E5|nr:hypothetical protein [Catellatospora sp. TT07R-123]GHJ48723.1 hypothetical protein Cs7R123_60650 [Catellatospora sp. TT07R-123]
MTRKRIIAAALLASAATAAMHVRLAPPVPAALTGSAADGPIPLPEPGRGVSPFATVAVGRQVAVGDVDLPASEASGLAASRRFPGVFYWLRDGGGATAQRPRAALWAIKVDADGNSHPVRRGENFPFAGVFDAANGDWEDIVLDDDDNLWIGDIGANDCKTQQHLFKTLEPDPDTDDPFVVVAKYPLAFPDPAPGCRTRNAEAMLWLDGELYIFAKALHSPLYRVELPAGRGDDAQLEPLGQFAAAANRISVSTLSDDRTRLTLAGHALYWVFTTDPALQGDDLLRDAMTRQPVYVGRFPQPNGRSAAVEGGSYLPGSHDVLFVAEDKRIFLLPDSGGPGSPGGPVGPGGPGAASGPGDRR